MRIHMNDVSPDFDVPRWHRTLFAWAAVMVFVLVMSGGIVCITDSSHGCPDWPTCHERWFPPNQVNSIIEYSHRMLTPLTLPFLIAAAVIARRRYRSERWILIPTFGAIVCLAVVVFFGALVILTGLPRGWAAVDLGTALMALALMVMAASAVSARFRSPDGDLRPSFSSGFARLALATTATVYAVLVSGVLVSRPGALMRCLNWPGVVGLGRPEDLFGWMYLVRFAFGVLASALIVALVVQVWRTRRHHPLLVRDTTIAGVLLAIATTVGALMPTPDNGILMPALSMAAAAALWAVLVAVVMRAGRSISEEG
jgi:cytochrome c oxidase assembly protein subunit 15